MVRQSATRGILRNMSQENASPPGMDCNIVETADCKACMALTRASSTNYAAQQYVCGGQASKSVFNTVASV